MKPRNPFDDDYVEAPKVTNMTSEILLNPFAIAKSPAMPTLADRQRAVAVADSAKLAELAKAKEEERIRAENAAKADALKRLEEEQARVRALQEEARKRQQEEEEAIRQETERRIREETERVLREEAEKRIREETERRLKEELEEERKRLEAQEEEERKKKEELERKAAEQRAKEAAEEQRAKEAEAARKLEEQRAKEAEQKAQEELRKEADRKAEAEKERIAKEEAKAKEKLAKEAEKKAKEEQKAREKAEKSAAKAKAKEEAERKKEEERKAAERKKEDERKAKEDTERKKEEERLAKKKEEEEKKKRKEEEDRKKKEEERKKKEEDEKRKDEEDKKKKEEERKKKEEEDKKKKEEEDRRKEEERKKKEEEEKKKKEDDEKAAAAATAASQSLAKADDVSKEEKARIAIAKSQAKEESDRRAVAAKLEGIVRPEESIIFFDSAVEGSPRQEKVLSPESARNPMLQRLHQLQKRNSFAVVQIDSDSDDRSSEEKQRDAAAEAFVAAQMQAGDEEPKDLENESGISVDSMVANGRGDEEAPPDKDLEELMANPFAGGNKIRIKIKNFEESSSDDENVIAGGKSEKPKRTPGGGGLATLSKPPTATLSGAPSAGPARRRKPIPQTTDMFAAPAAAAAAPTESVIEAAFPSTATFSFPDDGFGSAAVAAAPAPVVVARAADAPAFPSSFESPASDSFAAAFPPSDSFAAAFPPSDSFAAAFPPSDSFAAAFPATFETAFPPAEPISAKSAEKPQDNSFVATFPPVQDQSFVAAFPAPTEFVAQFPEQPVRATEFVAQFPEQPARAPPPTAAPQPPKSQPADRVPVSELKEMFSLSNPKARRLPAFPEEDMFADRHPLTTALRCTEMFGAAIRLLDVKSVRLFLQAGFNPESPVEDARDGFGKSLLIAGRTWLNLRRSSQGSEEVKVQWLHTLGTVGRVAQMKEMVAICKLLLLKGAAVSSDMVAVAEELKSSFGESRFLELLSSFPTRNELDSILTFPQPAKTEEETLLRAHLQKTAEILRVEHLKTSDPKVAAEAEKEYTKKLRKLPRAVVKKHLNSRIKPLLSPLLRPSEQIFCVCAVFDVIGVLNFVRRKGKMDVNERVEAWWPGAAPTKLTPLEVMCKFWVHSDGMETRTVSAHFVEYSRSVSESDCVEAVSALLHGGAEVTSLARELASDKGPLLKSLLEEKKVPKALLKKDEQTTAAAPAAAAGVGGDDSGKRKFKFGAKKDDKDKKDKSSKLTFGRSKTAPLGGIQSAKDQNPAAAAAVGAAEAEDSSE